jgi:hypothetical protein
MPVTYTFANATASIPLSQLDTNFATPIIIGNVSAQLGNTVPSIGNLTLANVTIQSVSSAITPAEGGTGLVTITANNVMLGNGTGNVQVVAPGTSGNVLTSNGTTWLSQSVSSSTPTSISNGTSNVSVNSSGGNVTVTTAGTLALTVNTSGAFGVGSSPSYGTSGQVLTSAGSGAAPTWSSPSAGAMTLISTQTVTSSVSSINFTNIPSSYNTVLVIVHQISLDTAAGSIQVQLGTGSGPTYLTSGYLYSAVGTTYSGSTSAMGSSSTSAFNFSSSDSSSSSGYITSGYFYLHNLQRLNSANASIVGASLSSNSSGAPGQIYGTIATGAAVTALQILNYNNGYNITKAVVSLYGISS